MRLQNLKEWQENNMDLKTKIEWNKFIFMHDNDLSDCEMDYLKMKMKSKNWDKPDEMKFPNGDVKKLNWKSIIE